MRTRLATGVPLSGCEIAGRGVFPQMIGKNLGDLNGLERELAAAVADRAAVGGIATVVAEP